jgi:hypothetical protein
MHRTVENYFSPVDKHFTETHITTSRCHTPPRECSAPIRVTAVLLPVPDGRFALCRQNLERLEEPLLR